MEQMKLREQKIKSKKAETSKYLSFYKSKCILKAKHLDDKTPDITSEEIKLKFDKLANYLDDYKRRLFLSDDVHVQGQNNHISK